MKDKAPAENLALSFVQKAKGLFGEPELIKVLKARAYRLGKANVLIRAATAGRTNRYFFGLNYIHAEELANLVNPFFAFVCGSLEQTVIVPAHVLTQNLDRISHDRNGEYKIIIDRGLNIALTGRGNRIDCSTYINAWDSLKVPSQTSGNAGNTVEQSFHTVLQGRLLEIGRIRGFQTFCPNKSKKFNNKPLAEIATLEQCPKLQFSDYDVLRQIDVLWFRERGNNLIPDSGFEVELSTGTWSGVGRLSTLTDYAATRLYIVSDDKKKYGQVMSSFPDLAERFKCIYTESLGELYSVELGLKVLREKISL